MYLEAMSSRLGEYCKKDGIKNIIWSCPVPGAGINAMYGEMGPGPADCGYFGGVKTGI